MFRLLIADDEMIERAVLYKTLSRNLGDQCEIFQAENGREALKVYEEKKIQIAILDIEMPGINGIQAAEQIREKDKDCCIIFLTAFDEFAYAKKAITVRAMDYLLKPYNEQELMLVLDEAMRQVAGDRAASSGVGQQLSQDTEPEGGDIRMTRVMEIITDYIRENYMYELSMQELARMMNYSEAYFCKLFKQCFNQNFTSYLTEYRVNMAKQLLAEPTVNVKEIGKAVGYGDANYFAKVFKRITGQSPTEYRLETLQRG
ncbi:MAG: response regulator [Eubacteriales bacterium]|nr:response regulator [Eubacteriales bacterium]